MLKWNIMDSKVCLVNVFWLGERRFTFDEYENDRLYFLKKQIECLQTYKHNLTKIIFLFNIEPDQYHLLSKVFDITPKKIQGSEVEIIIRKNVGLSYGAWSDTFKQYKSKYDYYIFNEDDYFFVQNNWDKYLVNKYNSYNDCGYLCMAVRESFNWNQYRKHAGSSNGIASYKNLIQVYNRYGKLPSLSEKLEGNEGNYEGWGDTQIRFSFVFLEFGLNVYDVRDDYAVLFQKPSPDGKIPNWKFHSWNDKYLSVNKDYWKPSFNFHLCADLEFKKEYEVSTRDEAWAYYHQKENYYVDILDKNGNLIKWGKNKIISNE